MGLTESSYVVAAGSSQTGSNEGNNDQYEEHHFVAIESHFNQ